MLSFDKLKKDWTKVIATNVIEFNKTCPQRDSSTANMVKANTEDKLQEKLNYITKTLEVLRDSHPVILDDKAIYDLAETERASIKHKNDLIKKIISGANFDSSTLELLNIAFELGKNIGSYNMSLGYQRYFEAGQKSEKSTLKSVSIREIRKESYFDIVELIYKTLDNTEPYCSFRPILKLTVIDQFLQPKIKDLSLIKDIVKKFTEKGYIKPKRGALTKIEREQKRLIQAYLPKAFTDNFDYPVNELYESIVTERLQEIYGIAKDEVKIIKICNKLLKCKEINNKLFSLPIKVIAEGIVTKFAKNAYITSDRKSYLTNRILLEIKLRHNGFYQKTIGVDIQQHHKNSFLELYTIANKKGVFNC